MEVKTCAAHSAFVRGFLLQYQLTEPPPSFCTSGIDTAPLALMDHLPHALMHAAASQVKQLIAPVPYALMLAATKRVPRSTVWPGSGSPSGRAPSW